MVDESQSQLDKAISGIRGSLERLATKGKLHDDPNTVLSRLEATTEIEVSPSLYLLIEHSNTAHLILTRPEVSFIAKAPNNAQPNPYFFFNYHLQALSQADFVIEAVPEIESLKTSIFKTADELCPPHTILATNTSSISITRLAATTSRPDRVIGMHFMNPVPIMNLIELIKGLATSDSTFLSTLDLAARLGKETCISADLPGFIINRILMPMINEAFFALMEGVASAKDIDKGMKLGTNQPMGPLMLADFIGLDTCLAIMQIQSIKPCPLLIVHVDAGWLGKKVGRGVYIHENKK